MFDDTPATARVGLLAPPSNAVMEVDFYRSLPSDITVHTSHIYRTSRTVSTTSMLETARNAAQTAMTLVQVEPTLILYGHSASSYAGGVTGNERIRREIHDATGVPALTTADATVRCLESIAADRIWLVAPYPPEVAQSAADYLTAHGFHVSAVVGMGVEQVESQISADGATWQALAVDTHGEDGWLVPVPVSNSSHIRVRVLDNAGLYSQWKELPRQQPTAAQSIVNTQTANNQMLPGVAVLPPLGSGTARGGGSGPSSGSWRRWASWRGRCTATTPTWRRSSPTSPPGS